MELTKKQIKEIETLTGLELQPGQFNGKRATGEFSKGKPTEGEKLCLLIGNGRIGIQNYSFEVNETEKSSLKNEKKYGKQYRGEVDYYESNTGFPIKGLAPLAKILGEE